jgi:hypothetical protein
MKKFIFFFGCCLAVHFSFGQNTGVAIREIDSMVKRIDSIAVSAGITDYILHKKGKRKKKLGGGADWFYTDTTHSTLIKVIRELSLGGRDYLDSYYFYKDSLIFLKTSTSAYISGQQKVQPQGEYYFLNGELISTRDKKDDQFNPASYLATGRQFFAPGQLWRRNR